MNLHKEYLELVQGTLCLLEEHSCVFASSENADFFRQIIKKKQEISESSLSSISPKNILLYQKPLNHSKPLQTPEFVPTEKPPVSPPIQKPLTSTNSLEPKSQRVEEWGKIDSTTYPSFASLFTLIAKVAPEWALLKNIPDDDIAKKIANRWKTKNQSAPITILQFGEPELHQKFLQEISKSLDVYFGPAKLVQAETIEKEKQWEAFLSSDGLKLILICDYTLWQLNGLMQFYKEVPAQGTRMLGKIPLFLLPDLSLYLKDPLLKRSLWKALCQKIL